MLLADKSWLPSNFRAAWVHLLSRCGVKENKVKIKISVQRLHHVLYIITQAKRAARDEVYR